MKTTARSIRTRVRQAFSLIEMMIVLGVVGLLLAFAAPNLFSLLTANTLTSEGSVLLNQLTLGQQVAVSKSADVEVRFFKMSDESAALIDEAFRAFQLYQYNARGEMEPISEFFRIRAPVAIHEGLSTLLATSGQLTDADRRYGFTAPHFGSALAPSGTGGTLRETDFVSFRFRPDGSTDLPFRDVGSDDTWYITLVQGEGATATNSPDNFVCLQVNPYNGQVTQYRP